MLVGVSKSAVELYEARQRRRAIGVLPLPTAGPAGPGTRLHELLKEAGFEIIKGCGCANRIAQMNQWGPTGCEANLPTIVAWLREAFELAKTDVPFEAAVVELVIREAIRLARDEPPPPSAPPIQPASTPP